MSTYDEAKALQCDPFEGCRGWPGDRVLKDKIVTARKAGPCHICPGEIQPGERVRTRSDVVGGQLMGWRWCAACCAAMASWWEDDGAALEGRYALRRGGDNE